MNFLYLSLMINIHIWAYTIMMSDLPDMTKIYFIIVMAIVIGLLEVIKDNYIERKSK